MRIPSIVLLGVALLAVDAFAVGQTETILYNFGTTPYDGSAPYAGLLFGPEGTLLGTTTTGGHYSGGTVFQLTRDGAGSWVETNPYDFRYGDMWAPYAGLTLSPSGNVYGAADDNAPLILGAIFDLMPASGGGWTEDTIFQFPDGGWAGAHPSTNLILDAAGNLYGTAQGGMYDGGVAFELSENGGDLTYRVLYNFAGFRGGEGASVPASGLIFDSVGNLYGMSDYGGTYNGGTVYELTPQPDGQWSQSILYSINNNGSPYQLVGGLTMDVAGNLYGTTAYGGASGRGVVFELVDSGTHGWSERTLYSFGGDQDGAEPTSSLVFDASGNLYGTTLGGGNDDGGTVFELQPIAGGKWTEKILHSFNRSGYGFDHDGYNPYAGLIVDSAGNLYGTTIGGGRYGGGTVFEITP
jgi:uncharacterized repeat protein (TIGR03803 family)